MSSTANWNTAPVVGMPVTWIDPLSLNEKEYSQRKYIKGILAEYGSGPFTILAVRRYQSFVFITLAKDGEPVMQRFLARFEKPHPAEFGSHLIRAVEQVHQKPPEV